MAEEICHHFTAPRSNLLKAYTIANLKTMNSQDEAMKWKIDFLPTDAERTKAIATGYRSRFELAEQFDVTELFIQRKLDLTQTRYRFGGQVFHLEMF